MNYKHVVLLAINILCFCPNSKASQGWKLIHRAAFEGNTEKIAEFLVLGANINDIDKNGDTPLHIAARNENRETYMWLKDKGADQDIVNKKGETPFGILFENDRRQSLKQHEGKGLDLYGR